MNESTKVNIYTSPKDVSKSVAKKIKKLILNSKQEKFHIAISGGNTPRKLFKRLAKKYADVIPWEQVHFWWGDERCVSPDSDQSNYRMASEALFQKIDIPECNIHRIKGENNPADEAERYAEEMESHISSRKGLPLFDLVLLGLGDDGHTASIFPGQLELFETNNWCAVSSHPESGQKRITLTGKIINNARNIFFVVTGENKAKRISEIMNEVEVSKQYPARYVDPVHGSMIWFIDEEGASGIS